MELFEGFTRHSETGLFSHPSVRGLYFSVTNVRARGEELAFTLELWVSLGHEILRPQRIPATRENLERLVIGLGGKL